MRESQQLVRPVAKLLFLPLPVDSAAAPVSSFLKCLFSILGSFHHLAIEGDVAFTSSRNREPDDTVQH